VKNRHIPNRVRSIKSLRNWSAGFAGRFPSGKELAENPHYWNHKVPFLCSTWIEGERAAPELQRECAQLLIDACARLIRAKPSNSENLRVTCCIAIPDAFSSELCIYLEESYFLGHTKPQKNEFGEVIALNGRSLAEEWRLQLSEGVLEHGVHVEYPETDTHQGLICDRWFFGEVAT